MTAIEIRNLQYTWDGAAEPALRVASLQVQPGQSVFLQGASGSGKSTLLSLLAGTLVAQDGGLQVLGTELSALRARQRDRFRAEHIGMVFQQFNLIPFLTVAGNLRLASRFSRRPHPDLESRTADLLSALRLDESLLHRRADRLSVGQQQRVAIARAVINEPEIILADEPTSALDADARDSFMRLLMSVRKLTECTLVFASHDSALSEYFETRVILTEINEASTRETSDV